MSSTTDVSTEAKGDSIALFIKQSFQTLVNSQDADVYMMFLQAFMIMRPQMSHELIDATEVRLQLMIRAHFSQSDAFDRLMKMFDECFRTKMDLASAKICEELMRRRTGLEPRLLPETYENFVRTVLAYAPAKKQTSLRTHIPVFRANQLVGVKYRDNYYAGKVLHAYAGAADQFNSIYYVDIFNGPNIYSDDVVSFDNQELFRGDDTDVEHIE